jgi:hypothetical protein
VILLQFHRAAPGGALVVTPFGPAIGAADRGTPSENFAKWWCIRYPMWWGCEAPDTKGSPGDDGPGAPPK